MLKSKIYFSSWDIYILALFGWVEKEINGLDEKSMVNFKIYEVRLDNK